MAKTVKKNETPKIAKKWYEFKIDPKILRPVRFAWTLASGRKEVIHYDSPDKNAQDYLDCNLKNCIQSYYFVLDKVNKRIFAYPIQIVGHETRKGCETAHYEKINTNTFYMWDENKQLWEIPYKEYRKYVRYDWNTRESIYEDVKAEPRKVSRLSTYYYKVQAQLPSYIRSIFSELYGKDFVYQNRLITDDDIRSAYYHWISWLNTKGRKYSAKTISATDELMNKFSSERRINTSYSKVGHSYTRVTLETNNGVTAICYYSDEYETFRQVFNAKTGKMENFIWKQDKWQKSSKLSDWQNVVQLDILQSYIDSHEYDYVYLKEAMEHFELEKSRKSYWYSPMRNLYDFIINYMSKPVIHQLLQIQNEQSRSEMYKHVGKIGNLYGNIPNRGKTMFAKLGINKYQFDHPEVIVYVKWLLNQNNIAHIDNQTWDRCMKAFSGLHTGSYEDKQILEFLRNHGEFSLDRWMKICSLSKQHLSTNSYGYRSDTVKQLYKDYYSSLSAMSEFGIDIFAYPLLFNDKLQLQRYHDEAARAVSNVRNKAQDEKFKMLYDKRRKMLENDGKYLIDMPMCSADLTHEGSYLHHCVGGYVNQVANGNTAIYFLRQASAPNEPWLTVEVRNKQCIQIHGSCNAWMGSKDEYFAAVPFLVCWFEKHEISYSDHLLTNMATGYGQSSSNREMPRRAIENYKAQKKLKKSS
jgi:hypothetical protein